MVLDELRLVEHESAPREHVELVEVEPEQGVGHHDDVGPPRRLGHAGATARGRLGDGQDRERRGEPTDLRRPVVDHARGGDDEPGRLGVATRTGGLVARIGDQGDGLQRLAQPHVVGEHSAEAVVAQVGEPGVAVGLVAAQRGLHARGQRAWGDAAGGRERGECLAPRRRLGVDDTELLELRPQVDVVPTHAEPVANVLLEAARLLDQPTELTQLGLVEAQVRSAREDEQLLLRGQGPQELVEGHLLAVHRHGDGQVQPVPGCLSGCRGHGDGGRLGGLAVVDRGAADRDQDALVQLEHRQGVAGEREHRQADEHADAGQPVAGGRGSPEMRVVLDQPVQRGEDLLLGGRVPADRGVVATRAAQRHPGRVRGVGAGHRVAPAPLRIEPSLAVMLQVELEQGSGQLGQREGAVPAGDRVQGAKRGKDVVRERLGLRVGDADGRLAGEGGESGIERLGQPRQSEPGGLRRRVVGAHVPGEDAVRRSSDEAEPFRGDALAVDDEGDGDDQGVVLTGDVDGRLDSLGEHRHRCLPAVVEGEGDARRDDLIQYVPQQRGVDPIEVQPGVAGVVGEVEPVEGGQGADGVPLARGAGVVRVRQARPGEPALHPAALAAHRHEAGEEPGRLRARRVAGREEWRLHAQLQAEVPRTVTERSDRRRSGDGRQLGQPRGRHGTLGLMGRWRGGGRVEQCRDVLAGCLQRAGA